MINGGRAKQISACRRAARGKPTGLVSNRTTAIRQMSWPKLPLATATSRVDSTKNVARIIHACQLLPVSTSVPNKPTATPIEAAQSSSRAATRARQPANEPRPDSGSPSRCPG